MRKRIIALLISMMFLSVTVLSDISMAKLASEETIETSVVENETVNKECYKLSRIDNETVKISSSEKSYYFKADTNRTFYALMDTRAFNVVFDDTGRVYITEHNSEFVIDSVKCTFTDDEFLFEFYDEWGSLQQQESTNGCGGRTPYGCMLYNLSKDELIKSCYHGGNDDPIDEPQEPTSTPTTNPVDTQTPTPTTKPAETQAPTPTAKPTEPPSPTAKPTKTPDPTPTPEPTETPVNDKYGIIESEEVTSTCYRIEYLDNGKVRIKNQEKEYVFDADPSRKFFALADRTTFNVVFDDTGKIYINEHNGYFVVGSVTCNYSPTYYLFRFFDKTGRQIQEEHSDGCGGSTPYGCILYDLTNDTMLAKCYGGDPGDYQTYNQNLSYKSYSEMDMIDYYNYEEGILSFDSSYGPYYRIDVNNRKILDCSSSGSKIKNFELEGNVLRITLFSIELPVDTEYVFNLEKNSFEQNDTVDYYRFDTQGILEFDSVRGPLYYIDYKNKKIVSCSSSNARLKKCEVSGDGKKLSITVYSDEFPSDQDYEFVIPGESELVDNTPHYRSEDDGRNTSRMVVKGKTTGSNTYREDYVQYFDYVDGILEFDSAFGPYYKIDTREGKKRVIDCSSDGVVINDLSVIGNRIILNVYSNELPYNVLYDFDISGVDADGNVRMKFEFDVIEWYKVYEVSNIIEFDTMNGPLFTINYMTGEIIGSSSENSEIRDIRVEDNILTMTLISDEFPSEYTYEFDLTTNTNGVYDPEGFGYSTGFCAFKGEDRVDYYNILTYENAIEFDTEYGPYYKIDLSTGTVLDCTSDLMYPDRPKARVVNYNVTGDNITLTVYSEELPYEMTYVFNTTQNGQNFGIVGYNNSKADDSINSIVESIVNQDYEGKAISDETMRKMVEAYNDGKKIVTKVQYNCLKEEKADKEDVQMIKNYGQAKKMDVLQYMDISIYAYADGVELGKIAELNDEIEFVLNMFIDMFPGKKLSMLRVHNNEIEELELEEDELGNRKFKSSKFSTYALVMKDKDSSTDEADNNKDSADKSEEKQEPKIVYVEVVKEVPVEQKAATTSKTTKKAGKIKSNLKSKTKIKKSKKIVFTSDYAIKSVKLNGKKIAIKKNKKKVSFKLSKYKKYLKKKGKLNKITVTDKNNNKLVIKFKTK
ncbi:hypothetical protein [Eubacterium xylanophilum]|uniref:hypothetical protein n=1 Tax=Eubacterium xylanophilum TaxID=39497 RepID=UPI000479BB67|nr:hypothetical protein [Eubacterium xylanophilum]